MINTENDLDKLTPSITHLIIDKGRNLSMDKMPPWIKSITFTYRSDYSFDDPLNPTLDFLPEGLEELKCSNEMIHTRTQIRNFPKSLKKLGLGGLFNEKLEKDDLPPNLEELDLGLHFNQEIIDLPKTLKHLKLSFEYNLTLNKEVLPPTLQKLSIPVDGRFNVNSRAKMWNIVKNLGIKPFNNKQFDEMIEYSSYYITFDL